MDQPYLGKKIAELRKAKSLTQEELVEKCNISVRTLQRIESGEVMPRTYTIKIIFAALGYVDSLKNSETRFSISNWLEQIFRYILDLFNLKTNKMKKITILSIVFSVVILGLFFLCTESKAQKVKQAVMAIEYKQKKWNEWINRGQIDSIMSNIYRNDACILPVTCGREEIREVVKSSIEGGFKIIDFQNLSINVSGSIAVQKSDLVYECSGTTYRQKSLTEWHLTNGEWFVVNDIMTNY